LKTLNSTVRLVVQLFLLFLAGSQGLGQPLFFGPQPVPQVLTINLKLPQAKSPNTFLLRGSYTPAYRQLGPAQSPPEPIIEDRYLLDPDMRYIPYQLSNRNLGLPGFLPLWSTLPEWRLDAEYVMRPLAPIKVRRSRSGPEQ